MVLNSGSLNRRIQVQRFIESGSDGHGGANGDWEEHGAPIYARRRDVSDSERMVAGHWDNKLVVRFIIRASDFGRGITRYDRILHEGVTFEIDGIKEVPDSRAFIEITAWTDAIA